MSNQQASFRTIRLEPKAFVLALNEIPGHGISFCGHCGREFQPQKTRRGYTKRFCTTSCRASSWRLARKAANETTAS